MPDRDDVPFFSRSGVKNSLREISRAKTLTIFIGTGASVDSGVPSWPDVLERLLTKVAKGQGADDKQAISFANDVQASYDYLAAGTIVQECLARTLSSDLRSELYAHFDPTGSAGAFARAIVRLATSWVITDGAVWLVTTNWDDLGLLHVWLTSHMWSPAPRKDVHHAQEVPTRVQGRCGQSRPPR